MVVVVERRLSVMRDASFDEWVARARDADILETAYALGAVLKRAGQEWVGPCPLCGGEDRFGVNQRKRVFICRGSDGGDAIKMVEHCLGVDFVSACEYLNNEPPPRGRREESMQKKQARVAAIADRRHETELRRAAQEKRREGYEDYTRKLAREIWQASEPIDGTLGEHYLRGRGIDYDLSGFYSLRFNPIVMHQDPNGRLKTWPALVCAVQGPDMRFKGIWRIFLDPADKGNKGRAPVQPDKAALGPVGGGAVWLGYPEAEIRRCEGVETGLGIFGIGRLLGRDTPVACCMSTSGLIAFQRPPGVVLDAIWPDADADRLPDEKHPNGMVGPGIDAAHKARAKALMGGLEGTVVVPTACHNQDWLDCYVTMRKEAYGI